MKIIRPRLTRTTIIAGLTTLLLAGGTAVAVAAVTASPVDSSGVIHSCYSNAAVNGSHALVLQDAGTSCPKGFTALSWNAQGPAGAIGPTGPVGPAGPTGPAGVNATTTQTVTATATVTTTPPTSTPTTTPPTTTPPTGPVPFPATVCSSPQNLGTFGTGQTFAFGGVEEGSSYSWFEVTVNPAATSVTFSIGGTPVVDNGQQVPAGSDVMDVATNCTGNGATVGVTTFTGAPGTYLIKVYEGSGGADGGYQLGVSVS